MLVYILLQVLLVFLKGFNFVLKGICGYSLYSGFVKDKTASKTEYDKCVHRCRIRFRAKPVENLVACRNNFLLSHISYESPSALLPDNVSLMGFTPTSALFAVVPENFDVYDSDHGAFFFMVQFSQAIEVLSIPLHHFIRFADDLGDPKGNVVLLSNTGRCGSTLLTRMMEGVPNTIALSEPDFITNVDLRLFSVRSRFRVTQANYPEFIQNNPDKLLEAGIRVQCKPIKFRQVDHMILKTRNVSASLAANVARVCPYVRHIFMYRAPRKNFTSYMSMVGAFPSILNNLFMPDVVEVMMNVASPIHTNFDDVIELLIKDVRRDYNHLRCWAEVWCMLILCYLEYTNKGLVNFFPIDYDELIRAPEKNLRALLGHCHMPTENLEKCLRALSRDSQKGCNLSQDNLRSRKRDFTDKQEIMLNEVMRKFNFPDIDSWIDVFHLPTNENNNNNNKSNNVIICEK